jgi:hypothetical protein
LDFILQVASSGLWVRLAIELETKTNAVMNNSG